MKKKKLLSDEDKNPNAPQIPDICDKYDIIHINFVEFMRETGIKL